MSFPFTHQVWDLAKNIYDQNPALLYTVRFLSSSNGEWEKKKGKKETYIGQWRRWNMSHVGNR